MTKYITFRCHGDYWTLPVKELRSGESEPMTETCDRCEIEYCFDCMEEHECNIYK